MNEVEGRLGRALLLRFDAGQPLTALSPAWAALCGLLVSGSMHLDARTLVLSVLLLLLVEPVMGGLWELVVNADVVANQSESVAAADLTPVFSLVEEKSRFLAAPDIRLESDSCFQEGRQRGRAASNQGFSIGDLEMASGQSLDIAA